MNIVRNPDREKWLFDEIRTSFEKEIRTGIHLTNLMTPRQAYFKQKKPLPATDTEIQYYVIGRGHEEVMRHVTGLEKIAGRQWNGITYSMDFFLNAMPIEHKTRRGYLAKEGEEVERYDHYLAQLIGYCACESSCDGELWVWSLVERKGAWKSEPVLACYDVKFTPEEIKAEQERLLVTQEKLVEALKTDDHRDLPLCPRWMCVEEDSVMIKKPFCAECQREFESVSGSKKHTEGKKTLGHKITPPVYKKTVEPKCKWWGDCIPFDVVMGNGRS